MIHLPIGGFSCVCDSSVPKGAGVSSSAAFEVLIAKIISYYYNQDSISPFDLACIAQYAETVLQDGDSVEIVNFVGGG